MFDDPPTNSHPVEARQIAEDRLWVFRRYIPFHLRVEPDHNQVRTDDFDEEPKKRLHIVSDASVHVEASKVAGAWNLFATHNKRRQVVRTLKHQ